MDVRFIDDMNPSRSAAVIDVLRKPRLWIPTKEDYGSAHDAWLEKTEAELISGTRNALLGQSGLAAVGAIVFRPEPGNEKSIGVRNISIDPSVSGRKFGTFMLRNVECIAQEEFPDVRRFEVDTKQTNHEMRQFLQQQGYTEVKTADLYDSGKLDVILEKQCSHMIHP